MCIQTTWLLLKVAVVRYIPTPPVFDIFSLVHLFNPIFLGNLENTSMKLLTTILISIALLSLTACSSNKVVSHSVASKASIGNSTTVIDLKRLSSLASITPKLAKHRTVFVGEMHTAYADHLNQLAVIKNMHRSWKQNTSIGLEMAQQPYQSYLDDYIAGKINEREMLMGIEWYDRWAYDFRLYRPIFDYARKNKIPLLALNIPKELTRQITKVGIKGLSPKERKQLPTFIDRSDKKYNKRITSVFAQHSSTRSKGIAKFLDAQLAWDEGMAYAAARYLKKNPQKRMVILAGGGHVIGGEGIPNRLDRMLGSKSVIVLNNVSGALKASQGDFLLDSQALELPLLGRIGIGMENSHSGVEVSMVSPHGAAKKAGIKKGDVILSLGRNKISHTIDVRLFMEKTKPGDSIEMTLKRNNKKFTKKLKLSGKPKSRFSMHRK